MIGDIAPQAQIQDSGEVTCSESDQPSAVDMKTAGKKCLRNGCHRE